MAEEAARIPPSRAAVDYDHHRPISEWDPDGAHADLRRNDPVHFSALHGGYWVVTSHELVTRCARDPGLFSSEHDVDGTGPGGQFGGIAIPPQRAYRSIPSEIDGPAFRQYRRTLLPWFAPAATEQWRPVVRRFAQDCLAPHLASGQVDLVLDLANPVPAMVTLDLVGLDVGDWRRFAEPLHALVYAEPQSTAWSGALEQIAELRAALADTVADRRRNPRDDLATTVVQGQLDGRPVEPEEAVNVLFAVVAGGVDTTTALLANALSWLEEHPQERRGLAEHPEDREAAREEFLRAFSPAPATARTTTCPVDLGAHHLEEGSRVLLSWTAANRDPEVFSEPDRLDLGRDASAHVAFGFGPHRCIGAPLARITFDAVLEVVLEAIPEYRIDRSRAARYPRVGAVNGWIAMPATFSPPRGN